MKFILDLCNDKYLNQEINIHGWIKKSRKMGSMIFMDVYDTTGYVQIVLEESNDYFELAEKTPKESVVSIKGILVERKSVNDKIPTGKYEINLKHLVVHSIAQTPPLLIQDDTDALEDTRLKYRYLDLRRPCLQNNIKFRSKFLFEARNFLNANHFVEIETPYLCKQTPEGARDYLVPTRSGNFYALPQSPQIFKQLLMVGGFERYFQVARCFRDEDLRADRQPEFTQLDMEFSFVNEEMIYQYIEAMLHYVIKKTMDIEIPIPFERMGFETAFIKYGSDKPDLRYDFNIFDVKPILMNNEFFKKFNDESTYVKAIIVNNALLKDKEFDGLIKYAKDNKAQTVYPVAFDGNEIVNKKIEKIINVEEVKQIFESQGIKQGTLFICADSYKVVHKALGALRTAYINEFRPTPKQDYKFVWIVDWPLYEYSEEDERYVSAHHPFTSPTKECIDTFDTDKENAKARSYDIVLNGYEVGGGSIRIHNPDVQKRVFESLGLSDEEIQTKFGFMINAFQYGVPPHGGIALGIERLLMTLLKTDRITDVVAFPKNSSGYDMMQESPSEVEDKVLEELHIQKIRD